MATLSFNGENFTVDHAVKGANYVHGYDASGVVIVSFDSVSDFSDIVYDGVYMNPGDCLQEPGNDVKFCEGSLKTRSGSEVPYPTASQVGAVPTSGGEMTGTLTTKGIILTSGIDYGDTLPESGTIGQLFFKVV